MAITRVGQAILPARGRHGLLRAIAATAALRGRPYVFIRGTDRLLVIRVYEAVGHKGPERIGLALSFVSYLHSTFI